jgi:hypothetical protein
LVPTLARTTEGAELRERLDANGYLFFRGLIDKDRLLG